MCCNSIEWPGPGEPRSSTPLGHAGSRRHLQVAHLHEVEGGETGNEDPVDRSGSGFFSTVLIALSVRALGSRAGGSRSALGAPVSNQIGASEGDGTQPAGTTVSSLAWAAWSRDHGPRRGPQESSPTWRQTYQRN